MEQSLRLALKPISMCGLIKGKIKYLTLLTLVFMVSVFTFSAFAENVNVSLNYGINKVAKSGNELPVELVLENRDTQDFKGYLNLNVYESNKSVFVYRIDVDIEARSTSTYYRTISITNMFNTVGINLYNRKEELVANERINIDLSFYNDRLIIGVISSDYNSLSYLDNLILTNSSIQTKIVPINIDSMKNNNHYLDSIDMMLISEYDTANAEYVEDAIYIMLNNGKPVFVDDGGVKGIKTLPLFLEYNLFVRAPYNFVEYGKNNDAGQKFIELLEKNADRSWLIKLSGENNSYLNNDYYNIGNLLNIVDRYFYYFCFAFILCVFFNYNNLCIFKKYQ